MYISNPDVIADINEQVAYGSEWLDENVPLGWENEVDLATLDLSTVNLCVYGQVAAAFGLLDYIAFDSSYGSYDSVVHMGFDIDTEHWDDYADELGHNNAGVINAAMYADLTEAWRELIAARRNQLATV